MREPCVYILASREYGTLYIGVTSDLIARLWQHRSGEVKGFTSQYRVYRLVRFEQFETMHDAISREKQLKRWHRQWKINLIESENPQWVDLAPARAAATFVTLNSFQGPFSRPAETFIGMDAETSSA
ncbi:MAG TPA: GIY-YIG nuclease family protein [Sphingomicrobium sp.]|nr:GIY-YIG nuclease family protein [Sphingomicrobium sp.]